ncbi:MAG: heme o synthase [Myxococcota bacterium]
MRDLAALGKPRLSSLVLVTTGGGLWLAPGHIGPLRATLTLIATLLVVAAANALNCFIERDVDAAMLRTRSRPLPAGRLEPRLALGVGVAVALSAIPALAFTANPLTAVLGALAFLSYVGLYTPMKRTSTAALLVGAVPGALPPLMGWTAVTGNLDAGGWVLFGILFFWQLPHFLAISLYLKDDYLRGGLRVFSVVHGERLTKIAMAASVILLIPVTYFPMALGMVGPVYGVAAAVLGLGFLGATLTGIGKYAIGIWARRVFLFSLVYLTLLFVALALGRL